MNHFLHKIDSNGLFLEDCFWEDGAYPETVGVPKMTAGSPAIPAVEYQAATETTPEVLAVAAVPEAPPMQEIDAQDNPVWTTEPVPAFAGNPIPEDLIETHCQGGFMHPKWDGTTWVEGGTEPLLTIENIRFQASAIILAKYPIWVQLNAATGVYPPEFEDAMKTAIASVITESNRLEDAITAGTQPVPNWPVL